MFSSFVNLKAEAFDQTIWALHLSVQQSTAGALSEMDLSGYNDNHRYVMVNTLVRLSWLRGVHEYLGHVIFHGFLLEYME